MLCNAVACFVARFAGSNGNHFLVTLFSMPQVQPLPLYMLNMNKVFESGKRIQTMTLK